VCAVSRNAIEREEKIIFLGKIKNRKLKDRKKETMQKAKSKKFSANVELGKRIAEAKRPQSFNPSRTDGKSDRPCYRDAA
jgi:hypothetical protein